MKQSKGFTLIELLVVIAIIGILSSIVLASLNTARSKGQDAAVKANLSGIRVDAEITYDDADPNSYETVCADVDSTVEAASEASAGTATCDDDNDEWIVSGELSDGNFWCVDYTGASEQTTGTHATGSGAMTCS